MKNKPCGTRPITPRDREIAAVFLSPDSELKRAALKRITLDPRFPDFLRENVEARAAAVEKGGLFDWLVEVMGFEDIPREKALRNLPPQTREKLRSQIPTEKSRGKGRPGKPFRNLDVGLAALALRAAGLSRRKTAAVISEVLFLTPEAVRSILKREARKD